MESLDVDNKNWKSIYQNTVHANRPRMGLFNIISSRDLIMPIPEGVPVYIRSPGINFHTVLKKEMIWGIEKIMSFVFPSWRFSSFTKHANGISNKSNDSS